jgi:hypothetical protein
VAVTAVGAENTTSPVPQNDASLISLPPFLRERESICRNPGIGDWQARIRNQIQRLFANIEDIK